MCVRMLQMFAWKMHQILEEVVWIWKVKAKDPNLGREMHPDNESLPVEGLGEGEPKGGFLW